MSKMPPPSYLANKPIHRLHFPQVGDSSFFQSSGRRHYRNQAAFSTPYALFLQDNHIGRRTKSRFVEQPSRVMPSSQSKERLIDRWVNEGSYKMKHYTDANGNVGGMGGKGQDALDRQVYNLQVSRQQPQSYSQPKHFKTEMSSAIEQPPRYHHQPTNSQHQPIKQNQPDNQLYSRPYNTVQINSSEPKHSVTHAAPQNAARLLHPRVKTEAAQQLERRTPHNVRFNPTYLSWIN